MTKLVKIGGTIIGVLILLAIIGAATGSSEVKNANVSEQQPAATVEPADTQELLVVPTEAAGDLVQVTSVVDGDTIKTELGTVRFIGVDTAEVVDPRKPVECYGREASVATKLLLTGKSVYIALNPNYERTDKYGRLLAYVKLAGSDFDTSSPNLSINEYLITEGFAREYTFNDKNPYQYQKQFRADELEAKNAKKGLWGKCNQSVT